VSSVPPHASPEKGALQFSMKKTVHLDERSASPLAVESTAEESDPKEDELPDAVALREAFEQKVRDCTVLSRSADALKSEIETLRSDCSVQKVEFLVERRALKESLAKRQSQAAELQEVSRELKQGNQQLEEQNLASQYHLNLWGIPLLPGEGTQEDAQSASKNSKGTFFPTLKPLAGDADPIPPVLRGDLASFCFPDLLHFLANSKLQGVLTVGADGMFSKLYLEEAVLQLAGWNNRDPDLRLAALLEESGLVPHDVLHELKDRWSFDLELAQVLRVEKKIPGKVIEEGLREHARVILSYLFQLKRGALFFQPGQIPPEHHLRFHLPVTDILLKTAAEMDEKGRVGADSG
jgi:hypothetical protein